jgi:AraC-like DNA-binding protein/CheY-like chemotaxis protein
MNALPIRSESRHALDVFVNQLAASGVHSSDINAVAIECLSVLQRRCHVGVPSLVDRFILMQPSLIAPAPRFRQCVEGVIAQQTFSSNEMQRISTFIYCDFATHLTAESIGKALGTSAARIRGLIRLHAGTTVSQFVRQVRLDLAAERLINTRASIKEVWAGVGYNDGCNFAHEFRARFGVSPSEYRAKWPPPSRIPWPRMSCPSDPNTPAKEKAVVMIVDDDLGMREIIGRHLTLSGFNVVSASTGFAGLSTAGRCPIDVGLIDYHLPDMSGIDCIRQLVSEGTTSHLLLFTADWSVEERSEELKSLGVPLVSKLCDLDELELLIRGAAR